MNKCIFNKSIFLAGFLLSFLLSATTAFAQNGSWVTDKRNVQGFKAISFETAGDLYIRDYIRLNF